jgi:Carboxypeptidase regulatory-like domain
MSRIKAIVALVCCLFAAVVCAQSTAPMGSISGIVLDVNGGFVPRAQVTLRGPDQPSVRVVSSDEGGRFQFPALGPGEFHISVSAAGFQTYSSASLLLRAAEQLAAPEINLAPMATTTNVEVMVTRTQLATEQLKSQEQQRVLGILPNFYSSYIWDAAPLSAAQKYHLAFRSIADPFTFVGTGLFAAAEQQQNTFPGYGQGAQGYAKRYGAAFADEGISRVLGSAVLPSLLHQDPRYFYRGSGSKRTRAFYAISSAIICRADSGKLEPNYSYVLGSFASGALSNLYHPSGDRGVGLTIGNGFLNIGTHAADNLIREFLLRKLTSKVPDYAQGKP